MMWSIGVERLIQKAKSICTPLKFLKVKTILHRSEIPRTTEAFIEAQMD